MLLVISLSVHPKTRQIHRATTPKHVIGKLRIDHDVIRSNSL